MITYTPEKQLLMSVLLLSCISASSPSPYVSHPTFTRSHYMTSLYFTLSVLAAVLLGKGSLDYTLQPNALNHRKKMNTEEQCLEVKMKSRVLWLGGRSLPRAGGHLLSLCQASACP